MASAISADGSVVVGAGYSIGVDTAYSEGFRWTSSGGMAGLGFIPSTNSSYASGISADGSAVVGASEAVDFGGGFPHAVRWTEAGGALDLGVPAAASAVSADGSVVVGYHGFPGNPSLPAQSFRWTQAGGMVGLGPLPDGTYSYANAISADGSVIVGHGGDGSLPNWEASLWTSTGGVRSLRDLLINDYGLDLTGWDLLDATGISADGMSLAGYGYNPSGQREAWIAHIPEPDTLSLLLPAAVLIFRRLRHGVVRRVRGTPWASNRNDVTSDWTPT